MNKQYESEHLELSHIYKEYVKQYAIAKKQFKRGGVSCLLNSKNTQE